MSGPEKTIKTPKLVENIENCSNNISKVQELCFLESLMYAFYIVNKVVKQDLKITLSQSVWHKTQGWHWLWISKVNQHQKNPQKSFFSFLLISLKGSKTDSDGSSLKLLSKCSCSDEQSWLLEITHNTTTKIWLTSTDLKNNPV